MSFKSSVKATKVWHSLTPPKSSITNMRMLPLSQISNKNQHLLAFFDADYSDNILEYNIDNDKWCKWKKYPQEIARGMHHTSLVNKTKTSIFIFNKSGYIIEINLKNKSFNTKKFYPHIQFESSTIIGNKLHIFGRYICTDNCAHFIWDETKSKLETIKCFSQKEFNYKELEQSIIHYIPSQKSIIIIGCYHYCYDIRLIITTHSHRNKYKQLS